ncbi:nucleoside hydrolase [Bimuria novae-zelandiae CBS 107.79]|uniref:Nucleoside hydrolase n=1 Tax=Bimuria novae-zelandiae CBS 107.79 TaxID=1447943 RepID=A0A6A5UV68_9PLEO|nr:nucleoside hydrolase [Bimuria novae-zelandiae CBS 107.79]
MAPNRIIIDTDPGVDDVLAMLLALSAKKEELEVVMLSLTFGNVEVQNCLRNVVTLFHYIEKEMAWRRENGREEGFEALVARKPIVAVGAEEPLAEHMMVADFFHGVDGLGGIHHSHPHMSPAETWKSLFKPTPEPLNAEEAAELEKVKQAHSLFTPSLKPAHEEMLKLLRDNEPDTITIVAIGPLTNLAIAAATDPEAFLRVKEVVVMGGAVNWPGNPPNLALLSSPALTSLPITPFSLTKQPPTPLRHALNHRNQMTPVKLFPLDITEQHLLPRTLFNSYITSPSLTSSPLKSWVELFLLSTFRKIASLDTHLNPETIGLQLHDPLPIWYALCARDPKWDFVTEDLRVETSGQWTRGCCVVDRRGREVKKGLEGPLEEDVVGDAGGWRDERRGNRVERCVGSPGEEEFAGVLLRRVFGGSVVGEGR